MKHIDRGLSAVAGNVPVIMNKMCKALKVSFFRPYRAYCMLDIVSWGAAPGCVLHAFQAYNGFTLYVNYF